MSSAVDSIVTGNNSDVEVVVMVVVVGTTERMESPCHGEMPANFESAKNGVVSGKVGRGRV